MTSLSAHPELVEGAPGTDCRAEKADYPLILNLLKDHPELVAGGIYPNRKQPPAPIDYPQPTRYP